MKKLSVALTTAAVGALVLLGAAPASAAGSQIDPGDSLYAINCDTIYFNWQLLSVEPSTAVSTTVGTGDGYNEEYFACAYQPAYNFATGDSYYIQTQFSEGPQSYLASIDVATGVSTEIGQFFYIGAEEFTVYPFVTAMAIGLDGAAYVLTEEEEDGTTLWSLDLATGELLPIGESLCCTWAFAVDPTTGKFYGIDEDNEVFEVDVTTGAFEPVAQAGVDPDENGDAVYSLQIDGSGRFWVMVETSIDVEEYDARLWSFTLDTASTPVYSGIFDDDPYYTQALLIIPGEPALAATGSSVGVAPIAAGALLLGGIVIVALRRRTARA